MYTLLGYYSVERESVDHTANQDLNTYTSQILSDTEYRHIPSASSIALRRGFALRTNG